MSKWDYVVLRPYTKVKILAENSISCYVPGGERSIDEALDFMGEAGWELVGIHPQDYTNSIPTFLYIFKRPREPEENND